MGSDQHLFSTQVNANSKLHDERKLMSIHTTRNRWSTPFIASTINGEDRFVSYAYAMSQLCVLTLVHTNRHDQIRIISFRKASHQEASFYFDWLEKEWHES